MPSGSKKRKAAKKKMVKEEKEPNYTHSATHSHAHGDDDPKQYDEKDSDGGEVSSPASQEHHNHQHPFAEGEDEEVEKREDRSSVSEKKSMEGNNYDGESMPEAATEEEGVVPFDVEVKSEEDFESKNVIIESAKESHDGDSSGSSSSSTSSSSSDDESQVLEKKTVVMETAPPFDSAKPIDFLSEVVTEVNDSFPVEEANNWVVETASVVDLDKVSVLEKVAHVNEGAFVDNSMTSGMAESGLKENGETKLPSLDENIGVSPVVTDLEPKKNEDEMVLTSYENAASSSDAKDCGADANEDKLMLSFNAPSVDTSNGAEHVKDSETPEYSGSQPLVASAPRKVQTTDWKSCCGIFELFTGSNR